MGEGSAREPCKFIDDSSGVSRLRAIPSGVWALGSVPLLMDFSSEMIHALLPISVWRDGRLNGGRWESSKASPKRPPR